VRIIVDIISIHDNHDRRTDGLQLVEGAVDLHEVRLQQILHGFQRIRVCFRLCFRAPCI